MIYSQELCRVAKSDLSGIGVSIESDNPEVSRVLRECLDRVGATENLQSIFRRSNSRIYSAMIF